MLDSKFRLNHLLIYFTLQFFQVIDQNEEIFKAFLCFYQCISLIIRVKNTKNKIFIGVGHLRHQNLLFTIVKVLL